MTLTQECIISLFCQCVSSSGFIWVAVTVPASGTDALTIVPVIEQFFKYYGFEPMIVLDGVNSREMYVMTSLVFDREVPGQDQKAQICFERLTNELISMGYYPYRLPKPLFTLNSLAERSDDYTSVFAKLKTSLLKTRVNGLDVNN